MRLAMLEEIPINQIRSRRRRPVLTLGFFCSPLTADSFDQLGNLCFELYKTAYTVATYWPPGEVDGMPTSAKQSDHAVSTSLTSAYSLSIIQYSCRRLSTYTVNAHHRVHCVHCAPRLTHGAFMKLKLEENSNSTYIRCIFIQYYSSYFC